MSLKKVNGANADAKIRYKSDDVKFVAKGDAKEIIKIAGEIQKDYSKGVTIERTTTTQQVGGVNVAGDMTIINNYDKGGVAQDSGVNSGVNSAVNNPNTPTKANESLPAPKEDGFKEVNPLPEECPADKGGKPKEFIPMPKIIPTPENGTEPPKVDEPDEVNPLPDLDPPEVDELLPLPDIEDPNVDETSPEDVTPPSVMLTHADAYGRAERIYDASWGVGTDEAKFFEAVASNDYDADTRKLKFLEPEQLRQVDDMLRQDSDFSHWRNGGRQGGLAEYVNSEFSWKDPNASPLDQKAYQLMMVLQDNKIGTAEQYIIE